MIQARVDETYVEAECRRSGFLPRRTSLSKGRGNIWIAPWIQQAIRWILCGCAKRDALAAARFFRKVLRAEHTQAPWVITVDKNAAYPLAIKTLKADETLATKTELRQSKYLNNIIEQDHRNIKRIVKPMMGFKSFNEREKNLERD